MTSRVRAILYPEPPPWWPCWICQAENLCRHREPEIVQWMHAAPSLAQIAASRPERIAPAREISDARQLGLFAPERERRRA
jgi:hypothetical protein